jgi:ATP-dependent 26S proteasome regulatory subunit
MPKLAREIEPAVHQEQQEIEQSPKSQIQQLEQQLEQEQEKLTEKEAIISQLPEQIKQLQSPSKIVGSLVLGGRNCFNHQKRQIIVA